MITTPIYKFKKRQLTDTPNIEVGESNWDVVEEKINEIETKIDGKAEISHTHKEYENQNAFSTIKVGTVNVNADTTTDVLELVAGENVTLSANELNDSVTISAKDTVYVHPNDENTRHVTDNEKAEWNAKETTVGAQEKATEALTQAKSYVDTKVSNLVSDVTSSMKINTIEVHKNDGTTQEVILNIRGGESSVNNVFRSGGTRGEFIAQETTNTFTIENIDNSKEVFLVYQGSVLIENKEFTIDKSNGTVTLGFSINSGEYIDYEVIDTSYDYYSLSNIPQSFPPSEHTHNDKIDKTQIKNSLTEIIEGNVLDATQGKVLNDKIGDTSTLQTIDKTSLVNAINELKRTGGGGGATLNVFKRTSGTWGEFTATEPTNLFTLQGFNGTEKTLDLYYMGLPLIPNKQFTVSQIGEVTLGFELKIGESVDYCVSDVSFNYDELANKPNLDLKADKTYVDQQDKALSDKISVLNNDRGYKDTKHITNGDLNDIVENGKYTGQNLANAPETGDTIWWNIEVHVLNPNYIHQVATYMVGGKYKLGTRFIRVKANGTWQSWQQITTTADTTALDNKIKVLNVDRGYLTSAKATDIDNLKLNGKYSFSGDINGVIGNYTIDVIEGGGTCLQEATVTWGGSGVIRGRKLYRWFVDGKWQTWTEIATTTKTEILCTPITGYTFKNQRSYLKNGIYYINFEVRRTDDSNFAMGLHHFGNFPFTLTDQDNTSLSSTFLSASGAPLSGGTCILEGWGTKRMMINVTDTNTKIIILSGIVREV